jgi:heme/copper-type cytochrome/quinol oxidase subunit 3
MSATTSLPPLPAIERAGATEEKLGTSGMSLFIATEASLFFALFFAYFFLSRGDWLWRSKEPPKLGLAFVLLVILLLSSGVIAWGEKQTDLGRSPRARLAVTLTILLGLIFFAVQVLEYREHLKTLGPQSNAYGSIFYTVTSFHALHVAFGLCMLAYVLILPSSKTKTDAPHRAYHNAAMYWHFVDIVWIFVVALLYVLPHFR